MRSKNRPSASCVCGADEHRAGAHRAPSECNCLPQIHVGEGPGLDTGCPREPHSPLAGFNRAASNPERPRPQLGKSNSPFFPGTRKKETETETESLTALCLQRAPFKCLQVRGNCWSFSLVGAAIMLIRGQASPIQVPAVQDGRYFCPLQTSAHGHRGGRERVRDAQQGKGHERGRDGHRQGKGRE